MGRRLSIDSKQLQDPNADIVAEGDPSNTKMARFKAFLTKILENKYYTIFMTIITIYALFGDDIRLVGFSKSADDYFFSVTAACFFFFAAEVVFASIATEGYFLGFYFWLDILATVSLIFDIGWVWDEIVGTQDFSASNA